MQIALKFPFTEGFKEEGFKNKIYDQLFNAIKKAHVANDFEGLKKELIVLQQEIDKKNSEK